MYCVDSRLTDAGKEMSCAIRGRSHITPTRRSEFRIEPYPEAYGASGACNLLILWL
jgi:hypothetical protein